MQITGVSLEEFQSIVATVGRENYESNLELDNNAVDLHGKRAPRIRVRIKAIESGARTHGDRLRPGARRSWSGRRMPAACWHAVRDVLTVMFEAHPDAIVRTALATYKGKDGFHTTYPQTAYGNIGSMMQPAYMPEMCECER